MLAYRRKAAVQVTWVRYEDSDNWVVYSPAAADVHLLTDSAHRLWELLPEYQSIPTTDLASRLASLLSRQPDEVLAESVEQTLAFFDSIGIAEPVIS